MSGEWRKALGLASRSQRRQSLVWIAVIAATGVSTVRGYLLAYPSEVKRAVLATTIGSNVGFQALYGVARNIDSVGGFTAWRLTWILGTMTAVWGLLASTRLVRGEEENGRRELLLAAPVTSAQLLGADLIAVLIPFVGCWVTLGTVLVASGVPARGAYLIAAGITAPGVLFGAIGAFASQLYPDRRHAMGVSGALLGASFLLRVAADGSATLGWLRWATPLGWIENLRPFAGSDLAPAAPILATTLAFVALAFAALARRDFSNGLVAVREHGHPDSRLLRSTLGLAVRLERTAVVAWAIGIGAFAFVFGLLAKDVAIFIRGQAQLNSTFTKLGVSSLDRPQDFLGLMFTFFALPIAIFAATQVSAARDEEASGRLEALLVRPLGRRQWILARCLVATLGAVTVALTAALLAWTAAGLRHSAVGWRSMAEAGLNCLPATALLFGLGVLCLGVAPRLSPAVALGTVVGAYLLELVGALVNAPAALLDLSPFHHVAPVPAAAANGLAALVMLAVGAAALAGGVASFARRDLSGA